MKNKITPPTLLLAFLLLSICLHFTLPVRRILHSPYIYFGVIFIGLGIILNFWADALFKRKNAAIKPHDTPTALVTTGPFRISRHPMYLGMAILLLGIAIFLGSLITFILPIVFIFVVDFMYITFEEKNLESVFGQEYFEYKKKVRRWL